MPKVGRVLPNRWKTVIQIVESQKEPRKLLVGCHEKNPGRGHVECYFVVSVAGYRGFGVEQGSEDAICLDGSDIVLGT